MANKIIKQGYYQISVKMSTGFKFKVPARGYNLKSLLDFEKTLNYVSEYSYKAISQKEHDKLIYGDILKTTRRRK